MLKWYIEERGVKRITLAAPSFSDLVNTIIFGDSGIMNSYGEHEKNRPEFKPSRNIVAWPNGAEARLIAAEAPERARGINGELLLGDEVGSWSGNAQEFFANLIYGNRLGISQTLIVTTPRATPLMIDLFERKDDDVRLYSGTTFDNAANLSPQMLAAAEKSKNTRLGRQEVMAELILTNDAAAWNPTLLDNCRAKAINEFHPREWVDCVIGLDPSGGSTNKKNDEFGVITAIKTNSGKVLILRDDTDQHTGKGVTDLVGRLFDEFSQICPTRVIVEKNGAGAYVKSMILQEYPFMPVKEISATTKKYQRAVAAAHLYETEIVYHDIDAQLGELEKEQISWSGAGKSPNRIDALGIAIEGLTSDKSYVSRKKFIF